MTLPAGVELVEAGDKAVCAAILLVSEALRNPSLLAEEVWRGVWPDARGGVELPGNVAVLAVGPGWLFAASNATHCGSDGDSGRVDVDWVTWSEEERLDQLQGLVEPVARARGCGV